jgi:tetratricopeptide (TPR) repeat protein
MAIEEAQVSAKSGEKNVEQMIEEENHLSILELEGIPPEHRVVALIKLGRYEEALKGARNNSFEKAYCYYRLHKHSSALKTVGRKRGEKWSILKSHVLYAMGRYDEALSFLGEALEGNERAVNFAAINSLCRLQAGEMPSLYDPPVRSLSSDPVEGSALLKKMKDAMLREEVMYNCLFEEIGERGKYLEMLKENRDAFSSEEMRILATAQIDNLCGVFGSIDKSLLTKRNAAVVEYNEGKCGEEGLEHFMHFQRQICFSNLICALRTPGAEGKFVSAVERAGSGDTRALSKYIGKMNDYNVYHLTRYMEERGCNAKLLASMVPERSEFLVTLKAYFRYRSGRRLSAKKILRQVKESPLKARIMALIG